MSEVIALDFGSKYIGVATGNLAGRLASAYGIWPNDQQFMEQLKSLVASLKSDTVVVGLPLNLSGDETAQAKTAREFGRRVSEELQLEVVYQAETGTSLAAAKAKKPGQRVDDEAARIILQDYFDGHR